jgi:ubiquinone/menaquinone biosynthesis C-methylase UbiE
MKEEIKKSVMQRYGRIAMADNTESCCMPGSSCCDPGSPLQSAKIVGYDSRELEAIPQSSILGLGCGSPTAFADIRPGETVVDLGSGAGIDVFISARKAGDAGHVIGVDMTDEMLEKARRNARQHGYRTVEFRKGDIEKAIPVETGSADLVISNCVINLTTDKAAAFKEIHRILKKGGRMVISDLITNREVPLAQADREKWCGCIDGALTKENYLNAIRQAGFDEIQVLGESLYKEGTEIGNRILTSVVIRAVK